MRRMAQVLTVGAAALACSSGIAPQSNGGAGRGACIQGSESCPCYPNQTCDGTLRCISRVCVDLGTGGAGGGGDIPTIVFTGGVSGSGPAAGGTSGAAVGGSAPANCGAPAFFVDGACASTVVKGSDCTEPEGTACDKQCGPGNSGYKTETCTGGVYAESSTCIFPASCNFACFRLPTADAARCPSTPPQHNQPCNLAICNLPCAQSTPCEMCGVAAGYLDSAGNVKTGYCICIPDTTGGGKFACASYPAAWPCPGQQGC